MKKIIHRVITLILLGGFVLFFLAYLGTTTENQKWIKINQIKTEWINRTDKSAKMIYYIFQNQNALFSKTIKTGVIPTVDELNNLSNMIDEYSKDDQDFQTWKQQALKEVNDIGMVVASP